MVALGNQTVLGEPLRIDANALPTPIGEPPLEGDVAITFKSVSRANTEGVDARALSGGSSAAFFDPREGVYLAVFYTIKNESESVLIPGIRVKGISSLIDSQGRVWPAATYCSHGFEAACAIGVPKGNKDPRSWVDTGAS